MIIAWTYLLHAYYRGKGVDYRYFTQGTKRKRYDRTKHGARKHWELERCLNDQQCPLDGVVVQNLRFMIGLRHEIEHQMTTRIDDLLSARFQACCLNYHDAMVCLFGAAYGIAQHLSFSLQFSSLEKEQVETLENHPGLPRNIRRYIEGFDGALSDQDFGSPKFAYRVIFIPKTVNQLNQADHVIQFVKADSELAKTVNAEYALVKETERPKRLPSQIIERMREEGFRRFDMHRHTELWKGLDAKSPAKGYGVQIAKTWYWYDSWLTEVRKHCAEKSTDYR